MKDDDQTLLLIAAGVGLWWYATRAAPIAGLLQPAAAGAAPISTALLPQPSAVDRVTWYLTGLDSDWIDNQSGNRLFVNPGDVEIIASATGQPAAVVRQALSVRGWVPAAAAAGGGTISWAYVSPNIVVTTSVPAVIEITGPKDQRASSVGAVTQFAMNPSGAGQYAARAVQPSGVVLTLAIPLFT